MTMENKDKTTEQIRSELKRLIKRKKKLCLTDSEKNKAVNDSQAEINKKYGHDWRGRTLAKSIGKNEEPSFYEGHTYGEHWMD